jgi:ubiquinone/menaquinone biosynthesis C-methylase UbiE
MRPRVDYDAIATTFDERYRRQRSYAEVERAVLAFAAAPGVDGVLEVGCGTGHWLAALAGTTEETDTAATAVRPETVAGIDPSWGMLERARVTAPAALIARACAEMLPWREASFDRVLCVNVVHHMADPVAFLAEAARVLREGGGVMIIGLDPHTGRDSWWIYDHFPSALATDLARYPATERLREWMGGAGFIDCSTREVQRRPAELTVAAAAERGTLDRRSTSQLALLSEEEYAAGIARIHAAGEQGVTLRADLRLYATTGRIPSRAPRGYIPGP